MFRIWVWVCYTLGPKLRPVFICHHCQDVASIEGKGWSHFFIESRREWTSHWNSLPVSRSPFPLRLDRDLSKRSPQQAGKITLDFREHGEHVHENSLSVLSSFYMFLPLHQDNQGAFCQCSLQPVLRLISMAPRGLKLILNVPCRDFCQRKRSLHDHHLN